MTPELSAAVCTHRRYHLLDAAVASLLAQAGASLEVLVVDNSPGAPGSAEARARHEGRVRWIEEPVAGLSRARNAAMAAARAPVLAFLDDDARALPGWARGFLEGFARLGPAAACLGGRVRLAFTAPPPPWLDRRMEAYLSALDWGQETRPLAAGEWVAGASVAYRTAALREVGGFDPALGRSGAVLSLLSNDETELSDRLAARGLLTGYTPLAEAEHLVDPSRLTQAWFRRRVAWQAVSDLLAGRPAGDPAGAWQAVKDWLLTQDPARRTLRALVTDQPDAEALAAQMGAVHGTILALLAEAEDRDG
jgi:GT2 family glycosyltransferase